MDVSKNRGGPPKWMVKIMENPIKMDDLGVPLFLKLSEKSWVVPPPSWVKNHQDQKAFLVDPELNLQRKKCSKHCMHLVVVSVSLTIVFIQHMLKKLGPLTLI